MSEEMIVRHCSPTLAGMKTGNMFVCAFSSAKEMTENLRKWNRIFGKKGLRVLPLRYKNGHALIYIYRPARLSSDLKHSTAVIFYRNAVTAWIPPPNASPILSAA